MKYFYSFLLFLFSLGACAQKPILQDEASVQVIKQGLDKVYNFKFEEARTLFTTIKEKYPNHPGYDYLMALTLFWEMLCNDSYKTQSLNYLQYLNNTLTKADALYHTPETKIEGIFFRLAAQSSLTLYYSMEKDPAKTIKYAKNAYETYKSTIPLLDQLPDFYFTNGLYNYYVVKYPETHPGYKPFMALFISGDKEKGLAQLDYASKNGIFVKTEATNYLSSLYQKYELKPALALPYSQHLIQQYPDNLFFSTRNAEIQTKLQHWDEVRTQADKLQQSGKKYFMMVSDCYYGIIAEKQQTNYTLAEEYYQKVINTYPEINNASKDYLSKAYLGMGRIEYRKGDKSKALEYLKLARQYAEYDDVMMETDVYIKRCQQ